MRKLFKIMLTTGVMLGAPFADAASPPTPAPGYIPIVLQLKDVQDLQKYVVTLPYGQAAPIMEWIAQLEARAAAQKKSSK